MKAKIINFKNHIYNHRGRYSAAATLAVCALVSHRTGKELTEFLIEKGIDPTEYFTPEYYEELQAAAR